MVLGKKAFENIVEKVEMLVSPFPNDKFLDPSELKEFVADNFKFDVNMAESSPKG